MRAHKTRSESTILETQNETPPATANGDAENASLGSKIGKAGAAVLVAHLGIRLAGLIGKYIIPNFFGKVVSDVFTVVNTSVLDTAFLIGEQCLAPAYLPVFARARVEHDEEHAWRYGSVVFNLQLIALVGIVAVFICFPETFAHLLTTWYEEKPGNLERRDLFVKMLPFVSWGLIGMSLGSLTYVVLNGYKEFFFAAFGDMVLKLSVVGGAALGLLLNHKDWRFVAGGAVAGGTLKLITHMIALGPRRLKFYKFTLNVSDPYFKAFVTLALPLLAGILVSKGRDIVMTKVQTAGGEGVPTYFSLGRGLVDTIQFIIPYTLSIALLPYFCDLSARNDNARLGALLTRILRALVWFFIPVSIAMAATALPIAMVLFEGKELQRVELEQGAIVTRLYALQLPFAAIEMMVMQAFFSSRRVIAPTILGFIFSALSAGTAYFAVEYKLVDSPAGILTLVSLCLIVARILKSILLVFMLRMSLPVLPLGQSLGFLGRLLVAGAASGGAAFALASLKWGEGRTRMTAQALATAIVAFVVFLAVSLVLKMGEPREMLAWTLEKLKRKGKAKS